MLAAMRSPRLENWGLIYTSVFENSEWTEECQGLTTDGSSWFLTSNNESFRGIHKRSMGFKAELGKARLPSGFGSWLPSPAHGG